MTHLVVHSVRSGGIRGPLQHTWLAALLTVELQCALVCPEGAEGCGRLVGVLHPLTEATKT